MTRTAFDDVGTRAVGRGSLFFDGVRVPADHMLGDEGMGFIQVMQGFDYSRALIGLQCIAAAQASLAGVDQRLAQLNRPDLIGLRQAIAKDADSLKAMPAFDLTGTTVKLDNLAGMIDKLPLAIDTLRDQPAPAPKTEGDRLTRVAAELWHEMKQLIQIRRMDRPEAMLLSPEQAFFVRENVKLRLMDARTALLLRDETTYRADLKAVLGYLQQYFDSRAAQNVSASALVQQLAAQSLALKLPDLGASLAAARNARNAAERVKP